MYVIQYQCHIIRLNYIGRYSGLTSNDKKKTENQVGEAFHSIQKMIIS